MWVMSFEHGLLREKEMDEDRERKRERERVIVGGKVREGGRRVFFVTRRLTTAVHLGFT